jgi:hypothetical protein
MGRDELLQRERKILNHLTYMPRKILNLYGQQDNITEFVLHDLCGKDCFNLEKAAYFVDNPDFDCLKGIAGFSRLEAYHDGSSIWESPKLFSEHMSRSPFNQKVRSLYKQSLKKSEISDEIIAHSIAQELGFKDHVFYSWNMKYQNHGILLFERSENDSCVEEHLLDGMSLLSFCPVF